MEKRFVLFVFLSMAVVVLYSLVAQLISPPRPPQPPIAQDPAGEQAQQDPGVTEPAADSPPTEPSVSEKPAEDPAADSPPAAETEVAEVPASWFSLGSYQAGATPYLAYFSSEGAGIDRIELTARDEDGRLEFGELNEDYGYLGYLALTWDAGGLKVNTVGDGTPADIAGLEVGDLIKTFDGQTVATRSAFETLLEQTKPEQRVKLTVERAGKAVSINATLKDRPLALIRREPLRDEETEPHQLSCVLALLGPRDGLAALTELEGAHWNASPLEGNTPGVEFRLKLSETSFGAETEFASLEVVKRYRLGSAADLPETAAGLLPHHVDLEVEIRNTGESPVPLRYQLTSPNGLPLEGWWYSTKIHPKMFYSAGARDALCDTESQGRRLLGCAGLFKSATKEEGWTAEPFFAADEPIDHRTIRHIGVDTQYFAAMLLPKAADGTRGGVFGRADATVLGNAKLIPKSQGRTANVATVIKSEPIVLEPGASHQQNFTIFAGPKSPTLLAAYELDELIYYGWFASISKFLALILHFFYFLVGNYGLAIIMLTVLVRSCMFPISRQAAKNAAMMQELAPEMKVIAEKYKNDMEKRAKAQQDLFKKNNYNPFSGCWLMFLQLPVFIGLYRCLSVDIRLREAALIPGVSWASNLAGPDQLYRWDWLIPSFLASETGMLGPYLNVFPLITIALFLMHQKLFTPPATDEQQRMQLTMMKYMTLFIGVMFFKVAAGLCLYFIASSLWGIAERKLLPKPKPKTAAGKPAPAPEPKPKKRPDPRKKPPTQSGSNGSRKASKKRNKKR